MKDDQKKSISEKEAKEQLEKAKKKADVYINDPEKMKDLLAKGTAKTAAIKGPFEELIYNVKILLSLIQDWFSGTYKVIPLGSIIVIIGAVIYFISPIDLIPDFIPVAGYLDDAAVIALAYSQVRSDIDKYRVWKGIE